VMGETALPETPEAALELLRAKLTPPAPAVDAEALTRAVAEVEVLATETRGDVDDLITQVTTLQARLTAVEQAPLPPQVQRGGGEEPAPLDERIRTLERTIRAQRLSPQHPEVTELMELYQQRRAAN